MREKIRKKCTERSRGNAGFTLAEVLLAVLILLMVTAVVAGGVPTAVRVYDQVVDAANAQVLLSTTTTRLREELGTARSVQCSGTTITYVNSSGSKTVLDLGAEDGLAGITIQEYADDAGGGYTHLLVSKAAASKNLSISYDAPSYSGGVVTIPLLTVRKDGQTLATLESFRIRVLTDLA